MTTANRASVSRARRSTRPSGDDREQAILTTLEHLLEQRSLAEVSVDDLAKGAGLSRPTFYFYFPSKDAVLLTLMGRIIAEADERADEALGPTDAGVDPAGCWRAINALFESFGEHRSVMLAGWTSRPTNAEMQSLWSKFMQKWIDYTTDSIQRERDRKTAPETVPARDLAIALNLMNERTMFAAYAAEKDSIDHDQIVNTLAHVWVTSIYGKAPH